jgi:PKD repeat protein
MGGTSLQMGSNTAAAGMTTSSAASAVGDTNVKVASVTNLVAGQPFFIDTGQNLEVGQIESVGTSGATGTGVTLTAPLKYAHASGSRFHVNEGQPVGMTGDSVEHLNMWASGAPHGIDDESQPTEELVRALELPATYTSLLVSGPKYLGADPAPKAAVAYFETDPVNPTSTLTVKFDASFARNTDGTTNGLKYYWEFGDGTHATGESVSHTYTAAQWADVKLVVANGSDDSTWGVYRQAVAVNSPSGSAPSTPACGTFSAAERTALINDAKGVLNGSNPDATEGRD